MIILNTSPAPSPDIQTHDSTPQRRRRLFTSLQLLLSSIQPSTYTFMQISCLPCLTLTLGCINMSVEKICEFQFIASPQQAPSVSAGTVIRKGGAVTLHKSGRGWGGQQRVLEWDTCSRLFDPVSLCRRWAHPSPRHETWSAAASQTVNTEDSWWWKKQNKTTVN